MAKVITSRQKGEPGFGTPKQNWPRVPKALRRPRTLPTAIARDPSKGVTQPEFKNLVTAHGVLTPGRGGYKGARRTYQQPLTPPSPRSGTRVIAPPRNQRIVRR